MKPTALIAAAALTLLAAPDAQAASCSGRACNDKDPVTAGCNSGTTVAAVTVTGWVSSHAVRNRFSSASLSCAPGTP